jgi:hypothetical protein
MLSYLASDRGRIAAVVLALIALLVSAASLRFSYQSYELLRDFGWTSGKRGASGDGRLRRDRTFSQSPRAGPDDDDDGDATMRSDLFERTVVYFGTDRKQSEKKGICGIRSGTW